jgi:hypothetical protein
MARTAVYSAQSKIYGDLLGDFTGAVHRRIELLTAIVGLQCEPSRIPFSRIAKPKYLASFILSSLCWRRLNFPTTKAGPPKRSLTTTTPNNVMENGGISQGEGKDPSSFLSDIIGNSVIVKLNSGVVYKGEFLLCEEEAVSRRLTRVGCYERPMVI